MAATKKNTKIIIDLGAFTLSDSAKKLLQWLKQTARANPTEVPMLLQQLAKQLNQLLLDPQERRILAYFDFSGWLAKIITKR